MRAGKGTLSERSVLRVGRTTDGYVVRVAGRGSRHESPGLRTLAIAALDASPEATFVIDLSPCEYLDSTFLGCLVGLHKQLNRGSSPRLLIDGSEEKLHRLFGPSGLDRILPRRGFGGEHVSRWRTVPTADLDPHELGLHLLRCHRELAGVGGPQADAFAAIAYQLERELGGHPPPAPTSRRGPGSARPEPPLRGKGRAALW